MNLGIFIFGGAVLVISGILQALVRPRRPSETPAERIINGANLRGVFFVVVGVLTILVGARVVPLFPMGH